MSALHAPFHLVFVGRTGDGKSTASKLAASHLGSRDTAMFRESAAVTSTTHTHGVDTCIVGDVYIHDTPGLMDSGGVTQDEANIRVIVDHFRAVKSVHAFILVVNEQAPRFDDGMQAAVKLLVDSFGPEILRNMGILFTRADGTVTAEESQAKAAGIATQITARTGVPLPRLPSWQVECHPERFAGRRGVSPEFVEDLRALTTRSTGDMLRWSKACVPIDTSDAVIGEYKECKERREAEERAAEAERARVAAEAAAARERAAREAAETALRRSNETFFSLDRGFKVGGVRIW